MLLTRSTAGGHRSVRPELCALDLDASNAALDVVHVAPATDAPRVLCFVNTISPHHETRARAIRDTWGPRCDKLVFLSNVTDASIGAVAVDAPADHDHLWQKHKASLAYIWATYGHAYDWFYKADDDAYVILENLRAYLRSPEIAMQTDLVPLQLGHRFRLPSDLVDYYVQDKALLDEYKRRWADWWVFNSGGPGYAMNKLYMQRAVESFSSSRCLNDERSDMVPDDAAIAFCMAWAGATPTNTRDLHGRERWHANNPQGVYWTNPDAFAPSMWFNEFHRGLGGVQWQRECCSTETIAYHYVSPALMRHIELQLYECRPSKPLPPQRHDAEADWVDHNLQHILDNGMYSWS
ncbi:hypothetical protein SDRG_09015 [Saprolegnia diclina VS20]|uniref:N-acetylgalactosaminide beta-1,3-galactosyltransferase n=1 Tax=Saprolegnia diclina (strain VS20) TaxID=1156394 RepID=T0QFM9_SAPDV|nr:hypothetical protein SDRG_09015 [Saprolegnia diclina VS20]EQC33506.1 hypothetical protein SDRG_09015 [Saprolegnia diclina VS20]|eukprot:XP_008613146.1 hypothetical protein SDRG_09015 [Saprolegnia diclina VS20]